MCLNNHGLLMNIEDIINAADRTADWPQNSGGRTQIYYDRDDGSVWAVDVMDGNVMLYGSPSIISVAGTTRKRTPQWIADRIAEAVALLDEM